MPAFYALNNFSKAFDALANKDIGERKWLCSKHVAHLVQLELTDMPDSLRKHFLQFRLDMKAVQESCKAETLELAVLAMDDDQVHQMVIQILAMHEIVVHEAAQALLNGKANT